MRKYRYSLVLRLVVILMLVGYSATAQVSDPKKSQATSRKSGRPTIQPEKSAPQAPFDGLDTWMAQVMKDWKVPGLAIAVVRDGKIVLSKGYGARDVKNNLAVTPKTLFAIGSITKSFTVSALGMLADEGKLDWDRPVREYLPAFRMNDDVATEHMTPRDLVTHRSGLPRHDALWYNTTLTREQMVERLRFLEPSRDFRSTYQYNNLMFVTAGVLAQHISGMKWEDLVRQRIFAPLNMTSSNFSVTDSQKAADFARPYRNANGKVVEIPFQGVDEIAPAGSINSNVDEMARYLLFHMAHGKAGEKQLLSESNELQMQTPQMVIQGQPGYPEMGFGSYGMAFRIGSYRGHRFVQHGGAIDGFTAQLGFLPQDNIGVVVLTNLDSDKNDLTAVAMYGVFDRLLNLEPVNWSARYLSDQKKGEDAEAEAKTKGYTGQKIGTHPSHSLDEYVGPYENAGYGTVQIDPGKEAGTLAFTYNRMTSPMRHFHYDVFEAPPDPLNAFEKMKVRFTTDLKGDIDSILVPLEPSVKEIVFTRAPDPRMREKSFLEPLAGQYEVGGATVTIALKGNNTLVMSFPGQPERAMVPVRGMTFDVQGAGSFSVEFKKDASGAVTEMVLYEQGSTSVARKKK